MDVFRRRGIATVAIVVVIVVVIAAAGVGAYLVISSGGGNGSTTSHSTSTGLTTTRSTSTQTQSQGQSTTQTTTQTTTQSTLTTSYNTQSCTVTGTATTTQSTTDSIRLDVIPLFEQFTNMTMTYAGSTSSGNFSMTESYRVTSTSTSGGVTVYTVDLAYRVGGSVLNSSAAVDSNGNVLWVDEYGQNFTTNAQQYFLGGISAFLIEGTYQGQLQAYTGSSFTSTSKGSQTIGSVSVQVTEYTLSSTPQTFTECGVSGSLSTYLLDVGQTTSSFSFITYMHMVGTINGQSIDMTIQVTSLT
ncbi:MAG: hypothetical protein JRN57_02145 [Nitrososphaerota archaeon]|nr:hypothetical protein [Nitrososphaerota archaeon]